MTEEIKPPRKVIEIFDDYFADDVAHEESVTDMVRKMKLLYESDRVSFFTNVFSLVTMVGRERPDFALEMMLSWLKGKIEVVNMTPEASSGGVKFDS